MARIFIDGFESGQEDLWDADTANVAVVSSAGLDMNGSYCLDLNNAFEYVEKDITADDEMYFAFLYRPIVDATSEEMLCVFNGATILVHIWRNAGTLKAHSGQYTLLATGSATLSTATTYLIEIRIKIADSGGRIEVKVDGVQDIDFTGDTKPDANTQFDKVRLGYGGIVAYSVYAYFDNFIMDDADWIGDTSIQAVVPTGAGTTTGWTPSAGNNYECVDEKPVSDADYVSINSNDVTDTYAAGNLAGDVDSIKCVQVQSSAKTDGSPTPTNLKLVVRSGGTDYLSGDKAVPATAKSLWHLWENNPADAAAWEEADVNAMEIGVKSAA